MRLKFISIFLVVASVMLTACGPYHKLLKSDDSIAQYEEGMKYYKTGKYSRALALFNAASSQLYGTAYEDTVLFTVGKILYNQNDFQNASETMDQYRNRFPRSEKTQEAEYLYAMSFYMMSNTVEKDQTNTKKAINAFNEYINRHPDSEFVPEIRQVNEELNAKLYEKAYLNAALYYKLSQYLAAITSLKAVIKDNPETPYKEEAMYLICKSWYDYARNSVYSRQLDRYLKMIDSYYNFQTSFPDSKQFGSELLRMKNFSQDFVDRHGTTSQSVETSSAKVEAAKAKIAKNKDQMFYAKSKEERDKLRAGIKEAREVVKKESVNMRAEEKILRENEKAERARIKEMEKMEREAKKLENQQKDELRQQKIEELKKQREAALKLEEETKIENN